MPKSQHQSERFYWDSCTFLAWLLPEEERKKDCQEVLEAAELGEATIVTSSITLTEVIKLKGLPALKSDQEEQIKLFFQNSYIKIRLLDRFLAEKARNLIWEHGVNPKDSIHLATALDLGIKELHTYDNDLLVLNGKFNELEIRTPAARQRRITTAGEER